MFSDGWLADGVGAAVQPKVKNRIGYLKSTLAASAKDKGHDLKALLDAIEVPPKPETCETPGSDGEGTA